MIRFINIKKFKGLINLEYNFGQSVRTNANILKFKPQENENYNLIYGKNAVGKTRFLSVVQYLKNILLSSTPEQIDADFEISLNSKEYIYNLKIQTSQDGIKYFELDYSLNNDSKKIINLITYKLTDTVPDLVVNDKKLPLEKTLSIIVNKNSSFLLNILKLSPDKADYDLIKKFGDLLFYNVRIKFEKQIQTQYLTWQEFFETPKININELITEDEVNARLKYANKLTTFIKEIDPEIEYFDFGSYTFEEEINEIKYYKQDDIKVKLSNGNIYNLNSQNISQGITRIISVLQDLIWVCQNDYRILIIDEFDPFLHDFLYLSLTRVIIDVLKENSQIITVSHNSVVLNELKRTQIIFMDEIGGVIKLFNPEAKDINFERSNIYKRYLNEEYIKNSIFDSDVEGLFNE